MLRLILFEKANFARRVAVKRSRELKMAQREKAGEVDQHDAPTMKAEA